MRAEPLTVLFHNMVKFVRTTDGYYTTAVRSHPYSNSLNPQLRLPLPACRYCNTSSPEQGINKTSYHKTG